MKPKFEIGQKVKKKDGTCFEIDKIVIRKDEIFYSDSHEGHFYSEESLELVKEKPKLLAYRYYDGAICFAIESTSEDANLIKSGNWIRCPEYDILPREEGGEMSDSVFNKLSDREIDDILNGNCGCAEFIEKLQAENKILREAVEFYANRFSWEWSRHPTHERYSGEIKDDDSLVKFTEADGDEFENYSGGKRAREALEKIKQGEK